MGLENFSVILVEPKYDGNVGSVARVMKNFGFTKLVLIKPPRLGKQARANAMHGRDILDKARKVNAFNEIKDEFDFLVATSAVTAGDHNTKRTPIPPEKLTNAIGAKGSIGLVFGREDYGLRNEEIAECDLLVTIPADPTYPTLNLAQSAGIILYEIAKQDMMLELRGSRKFRELGGTEKRVLLEKYGELVDCILEHDFENRLAKKTFKEVIGRSFISGREAYNLIGLFRRVGEKLKEREQ